MNTHENPLAFCEALWHKSAVPVWLERFALAILASAFLGVVILNSMKLDNTQRVGIGVVILGLSIYVAQTLHLHNLSNKTTPTIAKESAASPSPAPTKTPEPVPIPAHNKRHAPSPPVISQHGQNNIAQIGNNNQAIINPGHPEPNIKWRVEDVPKATDADLFRLRIVMLLDQPMEDPGFHAVCDRPCTTTGAGVVGVSNTDVFTQAEHPNEVFVVFNTPNPIPPDVDIYWIIVSKDNSPFNVLKLERIGRESVKQLKRIAQQ